MPKIKYLTIAIAFTLTGCGGGSKTTTTTTIVTPPTVAATIESVSPNVNLVPGAALQSITIVGKNLLGVGFSLDMVPCSAMQMAGPAGGQGNWRVTVKCDIPVAGPAMLRAATSTNGSDISGIPPFSLQVAPIGTTPTITNITPLVVVAGQEFDLILSGTGLASLNGKNDGSGVVYAGTRLNCLRGIFDVSSDNTYGKITGCRAPSVAGTGVLRWYYDDDRAYIDAGTLTVTP